MKAAIWTVLPAFALLAACSDRSGQSEQQPDLQSDVGEAAADAAPQNKYGFAESLEQGPVILPDGKADARNAAQRAARNTAQDAKATAAASASEPAPQQAVAGPKIAYAYSFGFTVPAKSMSELQRKHAQLCEKMGPQTCRVMQLSNSGDEGDYAYGELELEVAAPQAKAFGGELAKAADELGGKQTSNAVSGEDLSKQIIDTEARLQARVLLRNRLMGLLARHDGSVAELIEAERGVADVNEEIDEAQRMLKEMNGRIEYSTVKISYQSQSRSGAGFLEPIFAVLGSLGSILGWLIAVLIVITISLVPITLFVMAWRLAWRRGKAMVQRVSTRAATTDPES
jgi:hypothetical protein